MKNGMSGRIVTNYNNSRAQNPTHPFKCYDWDHVWDFKSQIGYSCFVCNFIVLLLSIILDFVQVL